MNAPSRPEPTRWVETAHARIPVWIEGSGQPIVFVHGWPLTGDTWRGVVRAIGGRHRSIVLDLPGAGESQWDHASHLQLSELADAVVEVVRQVCPQQPVVLCGHDSGGGLARWAAEALGDHVGGIVLGNTEIPGVHSWRFRALLGAMQLPGAQAAAATLMKTALGQRLLLRDCVYDPSLISGLAERFLEPLANDAERLAGALAVIDGVRAADFDAIAQAHPRLTCPITLVWGRECLWFPLEGARAMAHTFGTPATFEEVPDAGLLVHEERPAVFAAAIDRLVAGLEQRDVASAV